MDQYAGIDVSLERSSICVVDAAGRIVRKAKVTTDSDAFIRFFRDLKLSVASIGLEAGPLSQWLHAGLSKAGFEPMLLEARHVKAALSAMMVKTDCKDARGIAQLLRMGWFRPVHCKSPDAQEVRALLVGRKLPTGPMLTEAVKAGFYETEWGKHPRLQVLTIGELLAGEKPDIPLVDPSAFRKARRESAHRQAELPLAG
jgi:hypothetical protein